MINKSILISIQQFFFPICLHFVTAIAIILRIIEHKFMKISFVLFFTILLSLTTCLSEGSSTDDIFQQLNAATKNLQKVLENKAPDTNQNSPQNNNQLAIAANTYPPFPKMP